MEKEPLIPKSLSSQGRRFDVAEYINHEAVMTVFLEKAAATGDAEVIRRARNSVRRARFRKEQAVGPEIT